MLQQEFHDGWVDFFVESSGMGCDVVSVLLVEVVMCWGLMVLFWLSLCCNM